MDISVIICVHNEERYISSAINSVLQQSCPSSSYELVVVDDGSTDGTLAQVENFSKQIEIVSKDHTGLADSINVGIGRARGEYIIRLDGDDTFEPDILEREMECSQEKGYVGVGCFRRELDMKRGSSKTVEIDSRNIFNWIGGGILFRKALLIKVGLYRDLIFEEYDILLRAAECGEIGVVKIPLYNYYLHGENMTSKDRYWINGVREFMTGWDTETLRKYGFYKNFGFLLENIDAGKNKR